MIHWAWLLFIVPLATVGGFGLGLFTLALCAAARDDDKKVR
jgi:hypothetical protein